MDDGRRSFGLGAVFLQVAPTSAFLFVTFRFLHDPSSALLTKILVPCAVVQLLEVTHVPVLAVNPTRPLSLVLLEHLETMVKGVSHLLGSKFEDEVSQLGIESQLE